MSDDAVTLHDLIKRLAYDYDSQGRRMSNNVEDRRHHTTPTNDTVALDLDTGQHLPPGDYIPKIEHPAGDPGWDAPSTNYNAAFYRNYEIPNDTGASLSEVFADPFGYANAVQKLKDSKKETLSDIGKNTFMNMLDKLEEWGWGG